MSDRAAPFNDAATSAVRSAEHALERAYWDVHCHLFALERLEQERTRSAQKLEEARTKLAVAQQVYGAVVAQFPNVEAQEIDTHGV